jgi:hypothetical protein
LVAAFFVVLLALTGLLVNHADDLGLDSSYFSNPALLNWYGIHAPTGITHYRTATLTVAGISGQLYVNQLPQPDISGELVGAADYSDTVVVALSNQLLLYTPQGELIERLDNSTGVPAGIEAIGVSKDHHLVVHTASGNYTTNTDFLAWESSTILHVAWSTASEPGNLEREALNAAWRGTGLSAERILLDLHSGRILGNWGVYLMDGAAMLFLLLAASGIWLWSRRRTSMRTHQHKLKGQKAD